MRRGWWVLGAAACALVIAGLVSSSLIASNAPPVPTACPRSAPEEPPYSGLLRSFIEMVPFTPDHALICRYYGLNHGVGASLGTLAGSARVDGAAAAKLASHLNTAVRFPYLGPVSCPMADLSSVTIWFSGGDERIRVFVGTTGCQSASNGATMMTSITDTDVVASLESLTTQP